MIQVSYSVCMQTRTQIEIHVQIELPSRMRGALIAFLKRDRHTYNCLSRPTVRDPMPRANALGNYVYLGALRTGTLTNGQLALECNNH